MKELTSPAREILDYVLQNPDACDTFDGIAHWWLLDQQLRSWLPRVDEAIQELVARGLLQPTRGPDGVTRYRANPGALATAQRDALDAARLSSPPTRRTTAPKRASDRSAKTPPP